MVASDLEVIPVAMSPQSSAPFALGTFADAAERTFPGLVVDERVLDLTDALTAGRSRSVLTLVEH